MTQDKRPGDATALKGKTGLRRLMNAFLYSVKGLKAAFRHEAAFREETLLLVPVVLIAIFLPVSPIEKLLLVTSYLGVMITELLNSAVEAVVDRIGTEIHELSGRAKDIASAAVLMSMIVAGLTWAVIIGGWLFA